MFIPLRKTDFWMARIWRVCNTIFGWCLHLRAYRHLSSKWSEDFNPEVKLGWEALISEWSENFSRGVEPGREALIPSVMGLNWTERRWSLSKVRNSVAGLNWAEGAVLRVKWGLLLWDWTRPRSAILRVKWGLQLQSWWEIEGWCWWYYAWAEFPFPKCTNIRFWVRGALHCGVR